MRAYFSTQPLHNPLSPPINWRFSLHLAAIRESAGASSDEGRYTPASPIWQDFCHRLFNSSLTCPLPLGKDTVVPRDLRTRLLQMHHPSVAHNTGRGIGDR